MHASSATSSLSRYGDTDAIRALARSVRSQGEAIQEEQMHLTHKAVAVPWSGVAADAMRCSVDAGATALRRTAALHFEAARALEQHAAEVDRITALIARIEHTMHAMVDNARQRLHGLAGTVGGVLGSAVGDPLDHALEQFLDRFDPPPSGHRDWLRLSLPIALPVAAPGLASLLAAAEAVR